MVNYNNAKIYKIIPINGDDESDVYFGSTTKEFLSQRMVYHRDDYRKWKNGKHHYCSIYAMFEKHGIENCKIVLLENVNANSKDEMLAREAYYIRNFKCINKNIPLRKVNEFMHEYHIKNREILSEKKKIYRANNKDKICEQKKIYREMNKEKICERSKKYYEANKEIINEKNKQKITCECGSICRRNDLRRHERSKKHIDFINNQNSNPI